MIEKNSIVKLTNSSTFFDDITLFQGTQFCGNRNETIIDNFVNVDLLNLYKQGYGCIDEIKEDVAIVRWFAGIQSTDPFEIPLSELTLD